MSGPSYHVDRQFHLLTYTGATTSILGDTVNRLWNSTQHYRRAFTLLLGPDGDRTVHYEHQLLVGALKRGDSEGCGERARWAYPEDPNRAVEASGAVRCAVERGA